MATVPEDERRSAGITIGDNAQVDKVEVHGPVIGTLVEVTEEKSYDVSDVASNPYRGLASFTYKERAFFGGRDAQISEALGLLTAPGEQRVVLLVTGASGSGKSSFVQAGLVPALEDYYQLHGGRRLAQSVIRPGRFPMAALAQALTDLGLEPAPDEPGSATLARTPAGQINVVVVDQLEELLTQSEPGEREAVYAILGSVGAFNQLRTHFVLTLRSDYLSTLFGVKPLYDLNKHSSIELRAMIPTELAAAIRAPLAALNRQLDMHKQWDEALVKKLTEDVGTDATLLPLLQVTLTSLWQDPPRKLVLGRYTNLTTALQSTADRVYEQDARGQARSQADRDAITGIFLDLVEVSMDDDPRRDVRRTVPRVALLRDHPARGALIDELVDKRLLSSSRGSSDEARIDIIHETLLTNWRVLKDAIANQREALQSRERFVDSRREWLDHARSDDYRLRGVYLTEARALAASGDIVTHDADARAFIQRSVALEEAERQREVDRLRRSLAAVAVTACAAVAAAIIAVFYSQAAQQQAQYNKSRELAAQSQTQLTSDPELSILLAREAEQTGQTTQQAHDALRKALVGSPVRRVLNGASALNGVVLSPDGSRVAASGLDGSVRVWSMASGALLGDTRAHQGPVAALAFATDGQAILTASAADSQLRLWDGSTGASLGQLESGTPGVTFATFSPHGRYIAAGTKDGKVRLWDAVSRQAMRDLAARTPLAISALSFSPNDELLVIGGLDGAVRVWSFASAADARTLTTAGGSVSSATFSTSGDQVLAASSDGSARLWDVASGAERGRFEAGSAPFSAAAFSPDGQTAVAANMDGRAWLWSTRDGRQLHQLRGHAARISSVTFSPSGADVLTTSDDATARVWDVATGDEVLRLRANDLPVSSAQFSRDGRTVVTASYDKSVRVWRVDRTPSWAVLSGHTGEALSVAYAPDGRQLATAGQDNSVRLWQPDRGGEIARRDLTNAASSVAFSPDGKLLAFGLWDGTATLLGVDRLGTADPGVVLHGHTDWIYSVAFSPDDARVLTASKDRTARIWNAQTGALIGELRGHTADVTSAAWDRDGNRIATSSGDNTARIWNAATLASLVELRGHTNSVRRVIFSPDGRRVVTASSDLTARVWDAETGRELATLQGHTKPLLGLAFSPDGKLLATSSADDSIAIWDTASWQHITDIRDTDKDVNDVIFNQDGTALAAASGDNHVRIYGREMFAPIADVLAASLAQITRNPPELTAAERAKFVHD